MYNDKYKNKTNHHSKKLYCMICCNRRCIYPDTGFLTSKSLNKSKNFRSEIKKFIYELIEDGLDERR